MLRQIQQLSQALQHPCTHAALGYSSSLKECPKCPKTSLQVLPLMALTPLLSPWVTVEETTCSPIWGSSNTMHSHHLKAQVGCVHGTVFFYANMGSLDYKALPFTAPCTLRATTKRGVYLATDWIKLPQCCIMAAFSIGYCC